MSEYFPINDELSRQHHLRVGLGNMAHGAMGKFEFQKACDNCSEMARKACTLYHSTHSGKTGGRLAIETSTYRKGKEASRRRRNMLNVLDDPNLDTTRVPCEVMWNGKRATKEYIAEKQAE